MKNHIPLVSKTQFEELCEKLPTPQSRRGRKPIPNYELLPGILYVLKTGCSWEYVPSSVCKHHYSSCWRRFKFWQKQLKRIWRDLQFVWGDNDTPTQILDRLTKRSEPTKLARVVCYRLGQSETFYDDLLNALQK